MKITKQNSLLFFYFNCIGQDTERVIYMSEKVKATIRNEKDERQEVEILVDDVELTPEMEAELSNGDGGEK